MAVHPCPITMTTMNKISVNLSEDKSACIDRLMRAMACGFNFNTGAFTAVMHLIASAAMGRVVHESDIIERHVWRR
eukprot:gene25080-biopygen19528